MTKTRKKLVDRIVELSTIKKVLLICLYLLLSSVFILITSNRFNIKYKVTNETSVFSNYTVEQTDQGSIYTMDLDNTYAKRVFVKYSSEDVFDMRLRYKIIENDVTTFEMDELNKCSEVIDQNVYKVNNRFNRLVVEVPAGVEVKDVVVNNKITFDYNSMFILVIILLIAISILYVYKEGKEKVYIIFFTIFVSFGTFMIVSSPISCGMSWDDQLHYRSTIRTIHMGNYETSEVERRIFDLITPYHMFDTVEEQRLLDEKFDEMDKVKKVETYNMNVVSYTTVAYLPGSVLYYGMNKLGVPFSIKFRLLRIILIVIFALIISYAIKVIPKYKSLLFALGLIPTSLFVAASFNYDEWIICLMFLAYAVFIKMMNSDKVETKDIITFIICVTISTLTKVMYGPLFLLLLLIPNDKFKSKKNGKIFKLSLLVLTVIVMLTFMIPAMFSNIPIDDGRGGDNVSSIGQLKYIVHNPVATAKVFTKVILTGIGDRTFGNGALLSFAYLGGEYSYTIYLMVLFTIIIAYLHSCNDGNELDIKRRVFTLAISVAVILATYGILYLAYNDIGSVNIGGVQARYFTPILFLILYPFITKKIKLDMSIVKVCTIISVLITLVYIYRIYSTFFIYIF